jgi:hypothetical protein
MHEVSLTATAKFIHQFQDALADFKQLFPRRGNHFLRQQLSGISRQPTPATIIGWKDVIVCIRQSCEVTGLESGVKHWFRVAASNAHGQGQWSQPASARVN